MKTEDDQVSQEIKYLEAKRLQCMLRYFSRLGHDSNNLLSTISAGLQLSKTRFQPTDPIYKIVEKSLEANNKVANTFKEFQKFRELSRADKFSFNSEILTNQVKRLVEYSIPGSSDSISVTDKLEDKSINADYDLALLAVYQLVINAVEESKNNSPVYIQLNSEEKDSKKYSAVCVSDKGNGIPEIIMNNLYKPFNTTKSKPAAGLGLFVVNFVILEHEGLIDIQANKDGTSVTISFPL